MATGYDKLNIKSAIQDRSKIDLSRKHLTTAEIGQIFPIFNQQVIPGDKISVNGSFFSRLAPMVLPTYGKVDLKTASFFVPYYQIWDSFDAWYAGKTTYQGHVVGDVPYFTAFDIISLFIGTYYSTEVTAGSAHDFMWYSGTNAVKYYKFTELGRYAYKIFRSLGYNLPVVDTRTNGDWAQEVKFNAMPFLAFVKAYNDYMTQSQRYDVSLTTKFLECVRTNTTMSEGASPWYNVNHRILTPALGGIISTIKVLYDNDYLTSAWQLPNKPIDGIDTSATRFPVDGALGIISPELNNIGQSQNVLFNDILKSDTLNYLRSFDAYTRRNLYSGSKTYQQILSRFGIKTEDFKTHFSHFLDMSVSEVSVGDITSTSDTEAQGGSYLGSYAGKGIVSDKCSFEVSSEDFGQIVVLAWISVKPMYFENTNREVLYTSNFDYYTPEFDGVGVQPISIGEVAQNPAIKQRLSHDAVFGWTERYNEYRDATMLDKVTGDMALVNTHSQDMPWHLGRNISKLNNHAAVQIPILYAQNDNVVYIQQNSDVNGNTGYNRIFQDNSGDFDHFYLTCNFEVNAVRPIKNFNAVANLGEGSTQINKNGKILS